MGDLSTRYDRGMTYDELIEQVSSNPEVHGKVPPVHSLVIGGMGGSALAGTALSYLTDEYAVLVHRDYGLPKVELKDPYYIAISYSGNTEETLSFARAALEKNHRVAVVASGGQLLEFARTYNLPYAKLPEGIVPRNALMYLVRGLLGLLEQNELLDAVSRVRPDRDALAEASEEDAHFFVHGVPILYTSERNAVFAQMATCIFAESARMPSFRNTFPEMNHNELQAFDTDMPEGLTNLFRVLLIRDESDGPRILTRMKVYEDLMRGRHQTVRTVDLSPTRRAESLVTFWMRLLFGARLLAETRNINPDTQPLIDEFKKRL